MIMGIIYACIIGAGIMLLAFNIFPSFGGKFHTHPFWGRVAGAGIITTVISHWFFPTNIMVPIIGGPATLIVLVIAFLSDINRGRVR